MDVITSLQNSRIKNILKLNKAKERKFQNLFILEGAREFSLARQGGYEIDSVFVCNSLFAKTEYSDVLDNLPSNIIYDVSEAVFEKIAYRENSDGILVLLKPKSHTFDILEVREKPFYIVLEAVEKPGNLGAILRTADAAKVDAVIICDPQTDIYNPNTIRSSVGCVFTVPVVVSSSEEAYLWLKSKCVNVYAAELEASEWYHRVDLKQSLAIVMGTEADGLTQFWLQNADKRIKIPMRGCIDSLNVSVSTAVITYEAMRQREFID